MLIYFCDTEVAEIVDFLGPYSPTKTAFIAQFSTGGFDDVNHTTFTLSRTNRFYFQRFGAESKSGTPPIQGLVGPKPDK